jgi:hypothetical protein
LPHGRHRDGGITVREGATRKSIKEVPMRKVFALLLAIAALLIGAPAAFADQPPGLLGYEGQPGNQGG